MNPFNLSKDFYNSFIKYIIEKNKDIKILKRSLDYIQDIETFLFVINDNKEQIIKKFEELRTFPINIRDDLKIIKYNNESKERSHNVENECDKIIKLIEEIIEFSEKEKILVIYLKNNFWINLIKNYNILNLENINYIYKIREIFKKYNRLINILYEEKTGNDTNSEKLKKNEIDNIKIDINRFYFRDEFALVLDKNIKDFINENKDKLSNSEIVGIIVQFNPYFNIRDLDDKERYKNMRETYIFDYIDFSKIIQNFIMNFQNFNFEIMFEENINDYINKITEKIKDIQTFDNVIKLINVNRLKEEKQKYYFIILKEKCELIIEKNIKLIKEEDELNKAIQVIAEFVSKLFLFEKNNNYLDDKIEKLDNEIKDLIYIELINKYNGEEYKEQKEHIYDIYLKKIKTKEGRDNVLKFMKKLSEEEKKYLIYEKLLEKCQFTKKEFFSDEENYKIKTLCEIKKEFENDKKYLDLFYQEEQGNKSARYLKYILDEIKEDLDKGYILKKDLEKFLKIKRIKKEEIDKDKNKEEKNMNKENNIKNNEIGVVEKLGLISLTLRQYDPIIKYSEYKMIIENINEKLEKLTFIKDSLLIYHKNLYYEDIKTITSIINEIENNPVINIKNEEMQHKIKKMQYHECLCHEIKRVKDFLLFKKIYENAQGKDKLERFENAYKILKELKLKFKENNPNIEMIFEDKNFNYIFKNIKEELGKKDKSEIELFINQMIEYFNIKDKSLIKDLTILIKSKKYEIIIKSIIYFFDNFTNEKLNLPKYLDLSQLKLEELKKILNDLKFDNIFFDYESNNNFDKVFTSFYEKSEAIDFLKRHINTDEKVLNKKLKNNLEPINNNISFKDIDDTIGCLTHFKNLKNKNNTEIINYIKLLSEKEILKFVNYSKKYIFIIELNDAIGKDKFEEVYEIINDANLLFNLDKEDFCYITIKGDYKKIKNIEELFKLKNKIIFLPKKSEKEKDLYENKSDKLLFFKDIISNIEIISDQMNILRKKGFNIPISINIKIKYPNVSHRLNNKEKDINEIKEYLLKIKNDYENLLYKIYESEKYLRILYGKLFRKIKLYQEGSCEIKELCRYILNKTNKDDRINEVNYIYNIQLDEDYEEQYKEYSKNIFKSISRYLIDLFMSNKTNYKEHYEKMIIKDEYKNIKGISIKKCKKHSIEEYNLYLFIKYLGKLPIAQNILICNKETSLEEMQSFLYRAILCDYNTLFLIEILESFSNIQLGKMFNIIDKLLEIKFQKYIKDNKDINNINKETTKDYLNSYIVFIYKNIDNEFALKNQLEKYINNEIDNLKNLNTGINNFIHDNGLLKKIRVISSDVCGLGKSFKIKKMINEENKRYYHFPMGGKITKNDIYKKIKNLFQKIKKESNDINYAEEYSSFDNVAIHLDLYETKEIFLINEFLFSFLITKFYIANENIIYIPDNLQIYIEVPNSFENYLTKFSILNIFNIENIKLGKLPPLELDSNIRNKFKTLNGINTNEEIEKFIQNNFKEIGINEYSYHQVQIFIKLYLTQFDSYNKEISEKFIYHFFKSIKYIINGAIQKLLMNKKHNIDEINFYNNEEIIYIDEETKKSNKMINLSYEYLKRLKIKLNLPNDIEKDSYGNKSLLTILNEGKDNYVITEDNYKKMIFLFNLIKAKIPVIIMGETGCGKTSLIIKLSQILNNGEKSVEIININPDITDEEIINFMREMNIKSKNNKYRNKEIWVFFDEINTCKSFSVLIEIFINRTFNGEKLEDNIRLIGACNPYRKRPERMIELNDLTREEEDQLIYKVEQLPESLLYYVLNFYSIRDEDLKKYIKNIIQKLFNEKEEKYLDLTTEAINECHKFLRRSFGNEPSVVSLRDVIRFTKCVEFFQDYYFKKDNFLNENSLDDETKKLYKIKSIICSIYICYNIRLSNEEKRGSFEIHLQKTLLQIINIDCPKEDEDKYHSGNLFSKIRYQKLKMELRYINFCFFSDLLKIEEGFLLSQIELDRGIGNNQLLKENLFLLFLSIVTKIPLIIAGKPGTSKSLSVQLIYNSMRGKYSKLNYNRKSFFAKYPQLKQIIYLQGSELIKSEDIEEAFNKSEELYKNYLINNNKNDPVPIYMILFDRIDLAENAVTNPLNVLHNKLEYNGNKEGICFIGISNYFIDNKKMNRALYVSVPNLEKELNQLKNTVKSIVNSIDNDIYRKDGIFNIISRAYYEYKRILILIKKLNVLKQYAKDKGKHKLSGKIFGEIETDIEFIKLYKKDKKIKTEFHGNRDFYNLIKGVAIEGCKLYNINDENQIVPIINKFIERNFGGINNEIDIDFDLEFEDIKDEFYKLKNEILNEKLVTYTNRKKKKKYFNEEEDNVIKVSSIFLFKKAFNQACCLEKSDINADIYQISKDDLNKCINDNINDKNSRYLLLEISSNLAPLIIQNIKLQNPEIKDIDIIIGSPFSDNNNKDKILEIINCLSKKNNLIIIQNLDEIQPFLYDLYNMNYKIIDGQKFVRIYLDNCIEQLIPVNDTFKIIVLQDKNKSIMNKVDMAYINLFEKVQINLLDLLDSGQREIARSIKCQIRLEEIIKQEKDKFNYDLNDLLINCREEEIGGLVYKETINNVNKYKNYEIEKRIYYKIYDKISILLPEDIILILEDNKYYYKKKYYNIKQYIKDLNTYSKDLNNYKISIIYTFSNLINIMKEYNNKNEIIISEIKTEENLKSYINDIKTKYNYDNNNHIILIHFDYNNYNKMQFVADFINNYYKEDEYHYIFIIYLKRNFNRDKKENQRIYSIPNIYDNINQLFIDNLEGREINLLSLLNKNVKDILLSEDIFDDLIIFLNKKYEEKNKNEKNNDENIKNIIITKAKEFIESNIDFYGDCYHLVIKLIQFNYMSENEIDIISSLFDYIKENIFTKCFNYIFNESRDSEESDQEKKKLSEESNNDSDESD